MDYTQNVQNFGGERSLHQGERNQLLLREELQLGNLAR